MNILFVNNQYNLFSKADCGASQRSMRIIKAFACLGHVDVISFVDGTISDLPNVDVVYSQEMDMAKRKKGKFASLLRILSFCQPYSVYPINKEKESIIDSCVSQNKYDYIVVRYLYFACDCGLLKYSDRLLIDYDDDLKAVALMSVRQTHNIGKKVSGYLFAQTLRILSGYVSKNFALHTFNSSPDTHYPNSSFLPNISIFNDPLVPVDFSKSHSVALLVGNFRYFPNELGLKHFVRHILPIIVKEVPDFKVHIVGNIPEHVNEYRNNKYLEILGYVKDLRAEYEKCRCVVVPLYHGTGTSVKLVEAMSLNRAVVSTSIGARGLHPAFINQQDIIIAPTDLDFANSVISLICNEKKNHNLSRSALLKTQKYYSEVYFNSILFNSMKKQ